jgi:hypothetical protein
MDLNNTHVVKLTEAKKVENGCIGGCLGYKCKYFLRFIGCDLPYEMAGRVSIAYSNAEVGDMRYGDQSIESIENEIRSAGVVL